MVGVKGEDAIDEVACEIEIPAVMARFSICEHGLDAPFEIFLSVANVLDAVLGFLVIWIDEKDPRPCVDRGGIIIGGSSSPPRGEEISYDGMGVVGVDLARTLVAVWSFRSGIEKISGVICRVFIVRFFRNRRRFVPGKVWGRGFLR